MERENGKHFLLKRDFPMSWLVFRGVLSTVFVCGTDARGGFDKGSQPSKP